MDREPVQNKNATLEARLARREKEEQKQSTVTVFRPRILGPCRTWKIFYTQKEAFELAHSAKRDLHVFSFESECFQDNSGQRMFLVTSYEEFWHYYSSLKTPQRHHYEIIPEGSVCHLYFDLEFMKAFNGDRNGSLMTSTLITYVCGMLKKYWNIECDHSHVLQLDASTDVKFSRHLVFHMKNAAFKDNIAMGYFVRHIVSVILYTANESDGIVGNDKPKPGPTFSQHTCTSTPLSTKEPRVPFSDISCNVNKGSEINQLLIRDTVQSQENKTCKSTVNHQQDNNCCSSINSKDHFEEVLYGSVNQPEESHTNITIHLEDLDVNLTQEELFNSSLNVANNSQIDSSVSTSTSYSFSNNLSTEATHIQHSDSISLNQTKSVFEQSLNQSVLDAFVEENDEYSGEFLKSTGLTKEHLKLFIVKNKDMKDILFIDIGVYTKNRNFRLYLSTKLRKNNPLVIAGDNKFQPHISKRKSKSLKRVVTCREERLFLDSLVSNVEYKEDLKVLSFENKSTLVGWLPKGNNMVQDPTDVKEGDAVSPYPEVDQFVSTVINKGGIQGQIRRWIFFTENKTIIYDIARNRWCERIKRQHKSNNIMIVVVLARGIYYQKCHDPECKLLHYKSPDYDLPSDLVKSYDTDDSEGNNVDEFSNDTVADDLLLSAMDNFDPDSVICASQSNKDSNDHLVLHEKNIDNVCQAFNANDESDGNKLPVSLDLTKDKTISKIFNGMVHENDGNKEVGKKPFNLFQNILFDSGSPCIKKSHTHKDLLSAKKFCDSPGESEVDNVAQIHCHSDALASKQLFFEKHCERNLTMDTNNCAQQNEGFSFSSNDDDIISDEELLQCVSVFEGNMVNNV